MALPIITIYNSKTIFMARVTSTQPVELNWVTSKNMILKSWN